MQNGILGQTSHGTSIALMEAIVGRFLSLSNGLAVEVVDISKGSIGICGVCKDKKIKCNQRRVTNGLVHFLKTG
jgi:hypothetical protein